MDFILNELYQRDGGERWERKWLDAFNLQGSTFARIAGSSQAAIVGGKATADFQIAGRLVFAEKCVKREGIEVWVAWTEPLLGGLFIGRKSQELGEPFLNEAGKVVLELLQIDGDPGEGGRFIPAMHIALELRLCRGE